MAAPGSCGICSSRHRERAGVAHAAGTPVRKIARDLGLPESSLRRHFKGCRWQPAERKAPKPKPVLVTRQHLEGVAAEFGLTFVEMLRHHVLCRGGDVVTRDDAEAHELCELLGDGTPCCSGE